jgi:hypothetical protein
VETLQIGRVSVSSLTPDTEHLAMVNTKMDELAGLIRNIIDSIDETKFKTFMEIRARRLQHQFSPRLD